MGKCHIEIGGSSHELLYEDVRDNKGIFIETKYRSSESFKNHWTKMADNISRNVMEVLIQNPELIPIFEKFIKNDKEDFPDMLTKSEITGNE